MRPGRDRGRLGDASDVDGGEAVDVAAGVEAGALLDNRSGAHDAAGADHAAVTHDRPGFDDRAGADAAAVDHRPGADDHAVVDDQVVVRQQVQDGVLEDLHVVADAHRAVGVADDLDAGTDDRAFTDDDVAGDLGGREQGGRGGDRRHDPSIRVQLAHGDRLLCVLDGDGGRWRDGQVAVAQAEQAGEVVGRCRADDPGRAADGDDVARQGHSARHEGALAEEDAVAEPGAGHQLGGVADLAQVAHRRPDHHAAMAEGGATPDRRRDRAVADDHRVLQHRRAGPYLHGLRRRNGSRRPRRAASPHPGAPHR